tara:strand:- start:251 stop:586 length:336 start_codon:yes stop_codon:yes gene_type:complete
MACSKRFVDRNQDQNATLYCVIKYTDESLVALDMTGATSQLTIKSDAGDADGSAIALTLVAGDATGIFDLSTSLDGIPVGTYRYDIVTIDAGGTRSVEENSSIAIAETVGD